MLRSTGPVTKALIGLNVLVWLVLLLTGWTESAQIEGGFWSGRVNQALFGAAVDLPPDYPWAVPLWLTPITSAFLHAGLAHLAMNMLVLWFCGRMVEQVVGPAAMVLLYLGGAYGADMLHFWSDPNALVPVVGASGPISAILAVYFILFARRRPAGLGPIPPVFVHMLWLTVAWCALNLLAGFALQGSGIEIAVFAHIGGFVTGLLLLIPLAVRRLPGLLR